MEPTGQDNVEAEPPGWYNAEGDPPNTMRYWNGSEWVGGPVTNPGDTAAVHYPIDAALISPGSRVGARVIDWVILGILMGLLMIVAFAGSIEDVINQIQIASETGEAVEVEDVPLPNAFIGFFVSALPFLWDTLWIIAKGATPGKLMTGARIVNAKAMVWERATPLQAVLRNCHRLMFLLGYISTGLGNLSQLVTFAIFLVSFILLFTDSSHRTVMDRAAQTLVVRADVMGQSRPGVAPGT